MTEPEIQVVEKWLRNKEGLGFSCKITVEGKRIGIKFDKLDPCYERSANALCHQVIRIGIKAINDAYKQEIDFGNPKALSAYQKEFADKNSLFLNILVTRGAGAFLNVVSDHAYIFGLTIRMKHLAFRQGQWMLGNKAVDINSLRKII